MIVHRILNEEKKKKGHEEINHQIDTMKKQLEFIRISLENEQAIGAEKHWGTHQFKFLTEPLNSDFCCLLYMHH